MAGPKSGLAGDLMIIGHIHDEDLKLVCALPKRVFDDCTCLGAGRRSLPEAVRFTGDEFVNMLCISLWRFIVANEG